MNQQKENQFKEALSAIMQNASKENIELYKSVNFNFKSADFEQIWVEIFYPFKKFTSGLIQTEISKNSDVIFILQNVRFVRDHFETHFKKYEGNFACADKSRFVIKSLIEHFKTKEDIKLDFTQKYTYHLPYSILNNHESIIAFYKSVKSLFYGNYESFLIRLLKIQAERDCYKAEMIFNFCQKQNFKFEKYLIEEETKNGYYINDTFFTFNEIEFDLRQNIEKGKIIDYKKQNLDISYYEFIEKKDYFEE